MKRHFTASVLIVQDNKVLLIFHPKFQKWIQPGGHIESNETPVEAAYREVFEETGLQIELLLQENVWVESPNAKSMVRPYVCLLESIPAYKDEPEHQHIDFIYLARPLPSSSFQETDKLKWFSKKELSLLIPGEDIFSELVPILENVFQL